MSSADKFSSVYASDSEGSGDERAPKSDTKKRAYDEGSDVETKPAPKAAAKGKATKASKSKGSDDEAAAPKKKAKTTSKKEPKGKAAKKSKKGSDSDSDYDSDVSEPGTPEEVDTTLIVTGRRKRAPVKYTFDSEDEDEEDEEYWRPFHVKTSVMSYFQMKRDTWTPIYGQRASEGIIDEE